jgi:hypoxanthine phosphoribosyltransferase
MEDKDLPGSLLISKDKLLKRIKEMALFFEKKNPKEDVNIVILYRGGKEFGEDFISSLSKKYPISILSAKSYDGMKSSGKVEIEWIENNLLPGKIFILDDIADTGLTISKVKEFLKGLGKVEFIVMLKKERFSGELFDQGFSIGNDFVIGKGLDLGGKFRELEEIRIISS